jgi:hypothetical protein
VVATDDGTVATHQPAPHGWHIALTARHARSSIDLEGVCQPTGMMLQGDTSVDVEPGAGRDNDRVAVRGSDVVDLGPDHPAVWSLGAVHYIQTEEPWGGSNTPLADVTATLTAQHLVIHLEVTTGHAVMGPGGSPAVMPDNPLDNERADINADGVQVYLGRAESGWRCGYLCVPLPDGTVRVTALHVEAHHPAAAPNVRATPRATNDGWAMTIEWARTALEPMGHIAQAQCSLPFDLVVNERPPERERRRGQLALTGGGGFGYLRGDRHASAHPLVLRFPAHEDRLSPNPLSSAHG